MRPPASLQFHPPLSSNCSTNTIKTTTTTIAASPAPFSASRSPDDPPTDSDVDSSLRSVSVSAFSSANSMIPPTNALSPGREHELLSVIRAQHDQIHQLRTQIAALTNAAARGSGSDHERIVGAALSDKEHCDEDAQREAFDFALPALMKGFTTDADMQHVKELCVQVYGESWSEVYRQFFDLVVKTRDSMPQAVLEQEVNLHPHWYKQPWYVFYPQYFATESAFTAATFEQNIAMLPYIKRLHFQNICILPHYQSPMADTGYDVSSYVPRTSLGGREAFAKFMREALRLGLRVATDAVFNHTSTEHPWFQAALAGDETYLRYYVQRNGREKTAEWDRDGDIVCQYRDPDGTITERVVVFPDVDRTHGLWAEINGHTYQFYRTFYPFQVDLNLRNPAVISELLRVLADEVAAGVVGKRLDAVAHWIKTPGLGDGLPECHGLQALIKSFLRHLHRRAVLLPEVVRDVQTCAGYAGLDTLINGTPCASGGDLIVNFEMQAALREMAFFQTTRPFWKKMFDTPPLCDGADWINMLEHHDEIYMGFFERDSRRWMAEYIKSHGGVVYKNGMSAACRFADCTNGDEQRIMTSMFCMYIAKGTPMVYCGTELGEGSNWEHAREAAEVTSDIFEDLGVYTARENTFDARELHRGAISRQRLQDGATQRLARFLTRLNELREQWTPLRSGSISPLDSHDDGVLCMGRVCEKEGLVCVANVTPLQKKVQLLATQIEAVLGKTEESWQSEDLLTGKKIQLCRDAARYELCVEAFGRLLLCRTTL